LVELLRLVGLERTQPVVVRMTAVVHHGDCRQVLAGFADSSIDAIVTDPPYELGFMGKQWDNAGVAYDVQLWTECLRVLKPGGHLLAFGGTRTYHRMAAAIEDAGFEIRDSLHWVYGSGFPKSLDVSKAIDKQRDDRADIYRVTAWVRATRDAAGITNRDIDDAFGANGMGRHWTDVPPHGKQPAVPTLEQVPTLLDVLGVAVDDVPDDIRRLLWDLNGRKGQPGENWWKRQVVGTKTSAIANKDEERRHTVGASQAVVVDITAPATDAARQWNGWGTALKPAHEPIVVARKPLVGTVAANVLAHGTGALNIDGCRVGYASDTDAARMAAGVETIRERGGVIKGSWKNSSDLSGANPASPAGRWPANFVLTHTADCAEECVRGCPVAELDRQSGVSQSTNRPRHNNEHKSVAKGRELPHTTHGHADSGGASRFFTVTEWDDVPPFRYVAKPSRSERNADGNVANGHPTVKPLALMRWLVRLVTPPGGVVLDPFAGSGTTLVAATLEGFDAVGVEMTDEYLPIIDGRLAWATQQLAATPPTLFDEEAS
jgi:DNA modification methylase